MVNGDLLQQRVDAIVNPWNRNIIPWWLLIPHGVSGAIKRRAGYGPFRELARRGPIPLGHAVLTSAGRLPFKGIIHVAGIDMLWRATRDSISSSVLSAIETADRAGYASLAMPLIGAGVGGFGPAGTLEIIEAAINQRPTNLAITVVLFDPSAPRSVAGA